MGARSHPSLVFHGAAISPAATAADYALYLALVELCGVRYVAGAVAAGAFGMVLAFTVDRAWVFRGARRSAPRGRAALCRAGMAAANPRRLSEPRFVLEEQMAVSRSVTALDRVRGVVSYLRNRATGRPTSVTPA